MTDDPIRIAWAAGVIEGEGCIQATTNTKSTHDGRQLYSFCLRVVMTDRDILERLAEIFGVNAVHLYANTQGLGTKQLYRWEVRRVEHVKAICLVIYPHMGERRRGQIDHVLRTIEENPPVTGAERARRTWVTRRERETAPKHILLFDELARGASIPKAARAAGIDQSTVYRWRICCPELWARVEETMAAATTANPPEVRGTLAILGGEV